MFSSVITGIPPGFILILGALLIPVFKGKFRSAWILVLPVAAFFTLLLTPDGGYGLATFLSLDLEVVRIDALSRVFGIIFIIISFTGALFSIHNKDNLEAVSAYIYAGGALGVTFAGDFFSLYIFWEIMAVASTFVILARRTAESRQAAFRYVLVHVTGGLFLLAGILLSYGSTGSLAVSAMELSGVPAWLIFIGVAVNAAVFPFHAWLKDAYPAASATGAVFLSAFTTKSAVYVMARLFPGATPLIYLGALMTAVPIFYAVLENDIRRVLAYSLINQVGFMLCGVGIGTELSINGTVSHAFCHILYKALLFMSAGTVLHATGKTRCTDLGGLYKTMPATCLFCMVGAASISAFPLFSGFVSKSMIVSAAGHGHFVVVWLILQFASAGVFHHAGIKVPYFMFFSHDAGLSPEKPPKNMMWAMGIAAFLCVGIGVYPKPLYALLPYPVHYAPYTGAHVVGQLQLLMFGALAFCLLILSGNYPAEMRAEHLDTDWFYRKGALVFDRAAAFTLNGLNRMADGLLIKKIPAALARFAVVAPGVLAYYAVFPFHWLGVLGKKNATEIKNEMETAARTQTFPIGAAALAAVAAIILLNLF